MRILFLTHSFNSLTQRLYVALGESGHDVSVEFDINDDVTIDAVSRYAPDLIVAPFLKRAIPESVWRSTPCFVIHPGIPGDRGPSALDWAILNNESDWGVTVLEANAEMDAGDIWATAAFPMRAATKSSLYRGEVTAGAVTATLTAIRRFEEGNYCPVPLVDADAYGRLRPLCRQADRRIDWQTDSTDSILRKIRSADGFPGLKTRLFDRDVAVFDAHAAPSLTGEPGEVVARSGPAVGVATRDGGVWIGHVRDASSLHPFKLPAVVVLSTETGALPTVPLDSRLGYREIRVEEAGSLATIHFNFYNGAMGSGQCERLRHAFSAARGNGARVVVLAGGSDFWSNGMHLNLIEADASPADASWQTINAIDDLAHEIITATDCVTVAALCGNAGAGGVFLARAADHVWGHEQLVLNPHYKDMGNLYGSEYWTYLLPKFSGQAAARQITEARLPMGAREAHRLGLVDAVIANDQAGFPDAVRAHAEALLTAPDLAVQIRNKGRQRAQDEQARPLAEYRGEELERMRANFYGFDPSYHIARYNFVYKVPRSHTPLTIARHRRTVASGMRQAI